MKKRYIPSILIVLCLLIATCVGVAYAKYASVKKAENLFFLSADVKSNVKSEPYAAYSNTTKTLYFLNDILINAGETIPGTNDTATAVYTDILGSAEEDLEAKWSNHAAGIETVIFLGNIKPVSIYGWFNNCTSLTTIQGMTEHLEAETVTSMGSAFEGCTSLTTLDLSGFNTACCIISNSHPTVGWSVSICVDTFLLTDISVIYIVSVDCGRQKRNTEQTVNFEVF